MAVRRMNEICPMVALTLVFTILLFQACHGQTDSTAAAEAPSSQTNVMEDSVSTQKAPEDLFDPSTTNPTNSPAAADNQVADHPDATTQNAPMDITDIQTHTMLSTIETTTPPESVVDWAKNPNEESVHQDLRKHHAVETEPDTSSPTQAPVFVPLLVSGLILAALLLGLYVWKNHCHTKTSGMKLAEKSYMADKENQGNTLVSVAPLNPPEEQEKPSLNGESLETVKTQNPPAANNGHSTAKADTEL